MAPIEVFICYSRKDAAWADVVEEHLKPLVFESRVRVWRDVESIEGGDAWKAKIVDAIAIAQVAVLLVSSAFRASSFIHDVELPALLDRQRQGLTLLVPIVVGASDYQEDPDLARLQALNDAKRPLNTLSEAEVASVLTGLTRQLRKRATGEQLRARGSGEQPEHPPEAVDGTSRARRVRGWLYAHRKALAAAAIVVVAAASAFTLYAGSHRTHAPRALTGAERQRFGAEEAALDTISGPAAGVLQQLTTFEGAAELRLPLQAALVRFVRRRSPYLSPAECRAATPPGRPATVAADVQQALTMIGRLPARGYGERAVLDSTNLRGAQLNGALLPWAQLRESCLRGASLDGATLDSADLGGAILDSASFVRARLWRARLERVTTGTQSADFSGVVAHGLVLKNAVLPGAELYDAHLLCASFYAATLDGADFSNAHVGWADFRGVKLAALRYLDEVDTSTMRGALLGERPAVDPAFAAMAERHGALFEPAPMPSWYAQAQDAQWLPDSACATAPDRRAPASVVPRVRHWWRGPFGKR